MSIATMVMLEQKFTAILDQVDAIIHQAHERIIGDHGFDSNDNARELDGAIEHSAKPQKNNRQIIIERHFLVT